jgi:hypothetical protein
VDSGPDAAISQVFDIVINSISKDRLLGRSSQVIKLKHCKSQPYLALC